MKNSKNNSTKFSFEKFNSTLDKKQLNTLFGGQTTSNGTAAGGSNGGGIVTPTDVLG